MVRYSFPVGLFHSLFHAGLSRRLLGVHRRPTLFATHSAPPQNRIAADAPVPARPPGCAFALIYRLSGRTKVRNTKQTQSHFRTLPRPPGVAIPNEKPPRLSVEKILQFPVLSALLHPTLK